MTPTQTSPSKPAPGLFDHPVLSLTIAATWLLLRESLGVADLLWAAVFALALPRLLHRFLGTPVRPRAPWVAIKLTGIVLWDIVMSNLTVARIVLDPVANPQPAWVPVKLDTTHPTAIALFATIITTTPGTVSCVVDEQRGEILVHALDCADPADAALQMKARYERPLMEIFG